MFTYKKSKLAIVIGTLCAFSLFMQIGSADALPLNYGSVPTKAITIYNDSPNTIYPVIGTGAMSNRDIWLQNNFADSINSYAQTNLYRIYVNVQNGQVQGIPPNGSAIVKVPFYNTLASSPLPGSSNQYVDWWNGGQIYIYDQVQNVQAAYNLDVNGHASTKFYNAAPVISLCDNNGVNCKVVHQNIYSANTNSNGGAIGLPLNDPYQLAEYTFGGLVNGSIDPTQVDYDVSYVNDLYLPVAIEPAGNPGQGYTGTIQSVESFRNTLIGWLTNDPNGKNWPVFSNPNGGFSSANPKVPSSNYIWTPGISLVDYNDNANSDILKIQNQQATLWNYCINPVMYPLPASFPVPSAAECQDINSIYPLFEQSYVSAYGQAPSSPSANNLLGDVYGFNAVTNNNVRPGITGFFPIDIINADKPADDRLEYSYQSYGSKENPLPAADTFDPYVQLIHGASENNLNIPYIYAFPYDDAAGNTQVTGTGLIITVGGSKQLPNPNPNVPVGPSNAAVMLGAPSKNGPIWNQYGVCTVKPNQVFANGKVGQNISIPITATYPCTISMTDNNGQLYQFTLMKAPSFTQASTANCQSKASGWCNGVTVVSTNGIATPGPAASDSGSSATVTLGAGSWNQYTVGSTSPQPVPSSDKFSLPSGFTGLVTITDKQNHAYEFNINQAAPWADTKTAVNCPSTDNSNWCAGVVAVSADSINTPPSN